MNKIRRGVTAILLLVFILAPCISFGAEEVNELSEELVSFKNPSWDGSYQKVSDNEYLYPKYFYYDEKYFDLKITGNVVDPIGLKIRTASGGERITVSVLESDTGNIADLDNFYYGFVNISETSRFSFYGDITDFMYNSPNGSALQIDCYIENERTCVSYRSYTDVLDGDVVSTSKPSLYIKSNVTEENEYTFRHGGMGFAIAAFQMDFFLGESESSSTLSSDSASTVSSDSSTEQTTEPISSESTSEPAAEPATEPIIESEVAGESQPASTPTAAGEAQDVVVPTSNLNNPGNIDNPSSSEISEVHNGGYEAHEVYDVDNVNDENKQGRDNEYEEIAPHRKSNLVKTGDNKNIVVYSFVLVISAILLRIVRKAM